MIPLPTRKPDLSSTTSSILGDIWNSTKGVFEYMGGVKLEQWTADQLKDIRSTEQQAKMDKQQTLAGDTSYLPSLVNSQGMPTTTTYIGLALILGAVVLIAKD